MGIKPNECPYQTWKRTQGDRDEGRGETEAEAGALLPQTKEREELPEAESGKGGVCPSAQRECGLPTPWFQTSGLQTHERMTSVALNRHTCGNLLPQSGETEAHELHFSCVCSYLK